MCIVFLFKVESFTIFQKEGKLSDDLAKFVIIQNMKI
jgi:hypothetical protein